MRWFTLGLQVWPFVVGAVHVVEKLGTAQDGQAKQDAAVDAVRAMVQAATSSGGAPLLDDPAVEEATRQAIDAYVALQNAIAKRAGVTS